MRNVTIKLLMLLVLIAFTTALFAQNKSASYSTFVDKTNVEKSIVKYDPAAHPSPRQGGEDISSAITLTGPLPIVSSGTTAGYLDDYDEACPYTGSTAPDVVYQYTPANNELVDIDLCGSAYDTKVFVYENSYTPGFPFACNDDFYTASGDPCGQWVSKISGAALTGGNTYYIVIDGYSGMDFGAYNLEIREYIAPPDCVWGVDIICPSGALAESEACGDDDNGGCNMAAGTETWEPVPATGATICGTTWANGGSRDTDWFELVLTETRNIVLTADADQLIIYGLIDGGTAGYVGSPVCGTVTGIFPNNTAGPCNETTLDLGTFGPGTYWFFVGMTVYEGFPCDVNYWIDFDISATTCPPPAGLSANNITQTTAELGWNPLGSETLWNIAVGLPGFDPDVPAEWVIGDTDTDKNPWPAEGLTSATTYQFYVQAADCSAKNVSEWAGPFSFSTLCDVFTAPFNEPFTLTTIPNCWSMSGPQNWLFTTTWPGWGATGVADHTPGGGTSFAGVDGSGTAGLTGITLTSPFIDLTPLTTPRLRFYLFNNNVDSPLPENEQSLTVDFYDGAAWQPSVFFWDFGQNAAGWQEIIVDLSTFTISGPAQLKFVVDKGASNPFYDDIVIDDIIIEETPACPQPTALNTTNITNNSATLGWTSSASLFYVKYNEGADFDPDTEGTSVSPDPVTNTCDLSGLTSGTVVYWYVKADCGAKAESSWAGPASFTTQLVLPTPYFEGFPVTTTPTGWNTTGWLIGSTRGVTGNPGNNIYKNLWSSATTGTFTTVNIGPVATGMMLSFDYILANYSSPYAPPAAGSGNFIVSISDDFGATYSELETVVNDGIAGWRSKEYDVSAYDGENIKIKIVGNWISGDYDLAFDNFKVEVPPACPAPTALTATNITGTSADLGWTENGSATSWNIEWGLDGFEQGVDGTLVPGVTNPHLLEGLDPETDYEFYVQADCGEALRELSGWAGPFAFSTTESCPAPTGLTTLSTVTDGADVEWTSAAGEFEIEFGEAPYTFTGTANVTGIMTNSYSFTGLDPATTYQYKVKAICGEDDESLWSATGSFTTDCLPIDLPWCENFDAVTVPAIPACMTVTNDNADANQWVTVTLNPNSAPNAIYLNYNGSIPSDDWFFSPGLNLEGGVTYTVEFQYRARSTSYFESLEVAWGDNPNAAGMTGGMIWDNPSFNHATYQSVSEVFTPTTTGVYYIGWHGYSIADQWGIYVDDICVAEEEPEVPENRTVDGITLGVDDVECYDATMTITVTNTVIGNGASVEFRAGENILFGDGFVVESGAYMLAIITDVYCTMPLSLLASEEVIVPEEIPVIPSTESFFKVFPNPTSGNFKLELLGADEAGIHVEIFGMMGEKVFQDRLFGSMLYEFDLSNMPKGIYFIRVLKGDEMGIEKVIKQ